jgi:hypothetical protein
MTKRCGECDEYIRSYGICKETGYQKAVWGECDKEYRKNGGTRI